MEKANYSIWIKSQLLNKIISANMYINLGIMYNTEAYTLSCNKIYN